MNIQNLSIFIFEKASADAYYYFLNPFLKPVAMCTALNNKYKVNILCDASLQKMRKIGLKLLSEIICKKTFNKFIKNLRELGHIQLVKRVSWSRGV